MKSKYGRYLIKIAPIVAIITLVSLSPNPMVHRLSADQGDVTLDELRTNIFMLSCSTTSCHSSARAAGGLVLEGQTAYGSLVDVLAANPTARAAGKRLVVPGRPNESFLYQKLTGQLEPGEGDPMPQIGVPLLPEQIEAVRQWILKGALPSSLADIQLPLPDPGVQIVIPPFEVPEGSEVQGNYYTSLTNPEEMRVTRFEVLYPPGSHHLNLFAHRGGEEPPPPDGTWEWTFDQIAFETWDLRAGNQRIHLIWDLPPGVAFKFNPFHKVLAQIHFVNTGEQTSPIGGTAVINLHAAYDPAIAPITMGSMFGQNVFVALPPHSTTTWDYGITFDQFGIREAVKVAGMTGHFHWRGRSFEVRLWDGRNKYLDGSPVGCRGNCTPEQRAQSEFDRMGVENRVYLSENWDEPPFLTYEDGEVVIPPGWGFVYRCVFVNNTNRPIYFGPHVETEEHANIFLYFYPGPEDGQTLAFPLPFQR